MTIDELVEKLNHLTKLSEDPEYSKAHGNRYFRDLENLHHEADEALLEYIANDEVTAAYEALDKWYA